MFHKFNQRLTMNIFIIALFLLPFIGGNQSIAADTVPPSLWRAAQLQKTYTEKLMENPNVVGTAVGIDHTGNPIIQVFTTSEGVVGVPNNMEEVPVVVVVTGRIVAYWGWFPSTRAPISNTATQPVSHKAKQSPPIKLGTSGGWKFDLANGYCCSGTLGSLITDGSNMYILSNWHVLYSDIVSGGNGKVASSGDPVIQPGLVDDRCNSSNSQSVALLLPPSNGGSLPNANVDAGIAETLPGMVDTSGAILEIGTISKNTVSASIGEAVKKSGRSTGLSRSKIVGLNATVSVTYENECAGGTAFTKTFTGQIITSNSSCGFLNSGDSGSLMVEDISTKPRAVGLLYAGSGVCNTSSIAVANPINDVLNFYSAELGKTVNMVGN